MQFADLLKIPINSKLIYPKADSMTDGLDSLSDSGTTLWLSGQIAIAITNGQRSGV